MMQHDEQLAVASVSKHKKTVEAMVTGFGGEIINFYGDGSLSIFSSATAVLECAMAIQEEMKQGQAVPLRVGIHIGEILLQDGELYGDGVNIASRIESIGQAGTILFSDELFHKIRNNKKFLSEKIGDFEFKYLDEPMAVYALANEGFPVPKKESVSGKLKEGAGQKVNTESKSKGLPAFSFKKLFGLFSPSVSAAPVADMSSFTNSIAVLPFEKSGHLNGYELMADGIADEIRAKLLVIRDLKVISRNTCLHYKDKKYTLKQVGKDLSVNFVLEGRVQVLEGKAILHAELSDVKMDKLIWSLPTIQFSLENVTQLQNKIAVQIADELKLQLTGEEKAHLNKAPTSNTEAYLDYQRGLEILRRGSGVKKELDQAVTYFQRAIELDPDFLQAHISLADAYLDYIFWGRSASGPMLDKALTALMKALQIDANSGECFGALGAIYFYKMELKTATRNMLKAIKLSPGYVEAYVKLGWVYGLAGDLENALVYFKRARELDPLSTRVLADIGQIYYVTRHYEEGIKFIKDALNNFHEDSTLLWVLGYLYTGTGQLESAVETLLKRPTGQTNWLLGYNLGKLGRMTEARHILDVNLKKKEEGYVPEFMIATMCLGMGDKEKAMDWLEKDIDLRSLNFLYFNLKGDPIFAELRNNQRFEKILAEMEQGREGL
jgi:TolB-like protein/Tfp pilus assembly protein PilF